MTTTIIEAIRAYIRSYPNLADFDSVIGVDYLSDETDTYSIEETPIQPIVSKYMDGSTDRQFSFVFASREMYGENVLINIENSGFYEKFANWLESQTEKGILPDLGDGREAYEILAETSGYVFDIGMDQARYQIQCRLLFHQQKMN